MIKIAICDDEKLACELIENKVLAYMEKVRELCEVECFLSASQLLQSSCTFDLIFLDIQMPDQDGIALARKIRENDIRCCIIFITALEEYVYDAFEVEAIDYISKPVDNLRLHNAIDRAIKRLRANESKCLVVQTINWCKSVKLADIYYCEVINRKMYLHTKNGVIEYYCKLENIVKQLDSRFVRCHRSYLVNLDYLFEYSNGQITLEHGERIPTSRLRHQDFMDAMMLYMKRKET